LNPTLIYPNILYNLANSEQAFYHLYGQYPKENPFIIELHKSSCTNRIDFYIYSDDLYVNEIYYTTTAEDITKIFVHKNSSFYYIKTISRFSSCNPVVPSNIIIRSASEYLLPNIIYNKTVNSSEPTIFYIDIVKDFRYRVNFNASMENIHLQFDFYYSYPGLITRDFYHTYHFNNGEFTSKATTRAMLFLKPYEPGIYNFSFIVSIIQKPEIPNTLNIDLIIFLIILIFGILYVIYWLISKR